MGTKAKKQKKRLELLETIEGLERERDRLRHRVEFLEKYFGVTPETRFLKCKCGTGLRMTPNGALMFCPLCLFRDYLRMYVRDMDRKEEGRWEMTVQPVEGISQEASLFWLSKKEEP